MLKEVKVSEDRYVAVCHQIIGTDLTIFLLNNNNVIVFNIVFYENNKIDILHDTIKWLWL